jgi:tetratricopeptide (TPR) repeat protein
VHPIAENDLQEVLRTLANADLLYVRGIAPEANYQFKHVLIRDAAYEALLKSRRKELHRQVASAIEEKFAGLKETHPEILARHWAEAGETELAIAEWSRAGKAAYENNAFAKARESYEQALALLNLMPESQERDARELELRQSAYTMVVLTKGWVAPAPELERITTLAQETGNLTQLSASLLQSGARAWFAGDYPTAGALADQALKLGLRDGNPTHIASQYWFKLSVCLGRGDLTGAEQNYLAGLKFFDDPLLRQFPIGGPVDAFFYGALNALILGRPDIARQRSARMTAAVDQKNLSQVAASARYGACFHHSMREYQEAEAKAARGLELSQRHQLRNQAVGARIWLGAALAHLGRATEGVALIREGIAGMLRLGWRVYSSTYLMLLADAQDCEGASLAALETIEQALEANPDELIHRPEALRIRGKLRLRNELAGEAEADFHDSIALARSMRAKAWELRATMSLARLFQDQGHLDKARTILAEIYNWFTEGFDTPDVKEAKALLDELSA